MCVIESVETGNDNKVRIVRAPSKKLKPIPEFIEGKFVFAKVLNLIIPNKTRNKFIEITKNSLLNCKNYKNNFYCKQLTNFEMSNYLNSILTSYNPNSCNTQAIKTEKEFMIIKINYNKYAIITDKVMKGTILAGTNHKTITINKSFGCLSSK